MIEVLLDPLIMVVTAMAVFYSILWILDRVLEVHDDES